MKLTKKTIEKMYQDAYSQMADGIQFNIMDLGKLSRAYESQLIISGSDEAAREDLAEAIAKYRVN